MVHFWTPPCHCLILLSQVPVVKLLITVSVNNFVYFISFVFIWAVATAKNLWTSTGLLWTKISLSPRVKTLTYSWKRSSTHIVNLTLEKRKANIYQILILKNGPVLKLPHFRNNMPRFKRRAELVWIWITNLWEEHNRRGILGKLLPH